MVAERHVEKINSLYFWSIVSKINPQHSNKTSKLESIKHYYATLLGINESRVVQLHILSQRQKGNCSLNSKCL